MINLEEQTQETTEKVFLYIKIMTQVFNELNYNKNQDIFTPKQ